MRFFAMQASEKPCWSSSRTSNRIQNKRASSATVQELPARCLSLFFLVLPQCHADWKFQSRQPEECVTEDKWSLQEIHIIEKGPVDEALLFIEDKLDGVNENKIRKLFEAFISCKNTYANSFHDNINVLDTIYNKSPEVFFDQNNLYFIPEDND